MKPTVVAIALSALLAASPAAAPAESPAPAGSGPASAAPSPDEIPALEAVVVVRKYGEFRVRFFPEETPNHVAQFLTLAAEGYYDGMSFHRVVPRLLVQTGDPASRDEDLRNDGPGGPAVRVPYEETDRTHRRGTLSMAWRGNEPGTASSQWFVSLEDNASLDGKATPIGQVVDGMDTLDRISQVSTHRNRNPLYRVLIEKIRLEPEAGAGS